MAEEKMNNMPAEEVIYDDAAEQEKYLAKRAARMEEDFAKPFDPEADADHFPGSLFLFASQKHGWWYPQ